jgi:hypothetical protein
MTPKDKAKDLFDKFYQEAPLDEIKFYSNNVMAKSCALIAVNEIIKLLVDLSDGEFTYIYQVQYYDLVKKEIQKL